MADPEFAIPFTTEQVLEFGNFTMEQRRYATAIELLTIALEKAQEEWETDKDNILKLKTYWECHTALKSAYQTVNTSLTSYVTFITIFAKNIQFQSYLA